MKGILLEDKKIVIKEEKLRLLMDYLILDFGEMELPPMKISNMGKGVATRHLYFV